MSDGTDWFRKKSPMTLVSPWELNGEGKGQALVLRYAMCNMNCPMCYAWKYVHKPKKYGYSVSSNAVLAALNNLPQVCKKKVVWVRIQGGEPCLNYTRILNTISFAAQSLSAIYSNNLNYYSDLRAVVQTNGIGFSALADSQVTDIRTHLQNLLMSVSRGRIVFEVSFKSPHSPSSLTRQLSGYDVLLNQIVIPIWRSGLDNVAIYPLAGLGPSIDLHNSWIIPVDTDFLPQEVPLFEKSTWTPDFTNMVNDFVNNVVPMHTAYNAFRGNNKTSNGSKIAIEELEPSRFQRAWISGYAGKYAQLNVVVPPVSDLLRRLNNIQDRQWAVLFSKPSHWMSVLNQIPVSTNSTNLLSLVKGMNSTFYPSHPEGHYPFL